jgi:hypothetical protein
MRSAAATKTISNSTKTIAAVPILPLFFLRFIFPIIFLPLFPFSFPLFYRRLPFENVKAAANTANAAIGRAADLQPELHPEEVPLPEAFSEVSEEESGTFSSHFAYSVISAVTGDWKS